MSIQNDHFYFKVINPFKFKECYPLVELCGRRVWRDGSETERESEKQREGGWSECNTEDVKWFSNDWGLKSDRTQSRKPPRDVFPLPERGLTSPGILPESHLPLHTFSCQSLGVSKIKEWEMSYPSGTLIRAPLLPRSSDECRKNKKRRKLKVTHSFRVARSPLLNTSTVCSLLKAHLECVCCRSRLLHSNERCFGAEIQSCSAVFHSRMSAFSPSAAYLRRAPRINGPVCRFQHAQIWYTTLSRTTEANFNRF